MSGCTHMTDVDVAIAPRVEGFCEECAEEGTTWVALRVCKTCGHVGCCDSSPKRHAREHYLETGHCVMGPSGISHSTWLWCYVDEAYVEPDGSIAR